VPGGMTSFLITFLETEIEDKEGFDRRAVTL
jgi:hypothetical protein